MAYNALRVLSLTLFLHLHQQVHLEYLRRLLLRSIRLHRQPFRSCHLIPVLFLTRSPHLFLDLYLPRPLNFHLSHGMCCTLYSGLKSCAQLQVTTYRLRLVPSYPHNEFSKGLVEHLPYSHGAHP